MKTTGMVTVLAGTRLAPPTSTLVQGTGVPTRFRATTSGINGLLTDPSPDSSV